MYSTHRGPGFEEDLIELYNLDFNTPLNQSSTKELTNGALVCINNSNIAPHEQAIDSNSFWIEGVLQYVVGVLGIFANLSAIPALCSSRLRSLFNRLLASLLLLHTAYIILSLVMYAGREAIMGSSGRWFTILYSYLLYPLRPVILHSTTIIIVLMARQRYFAIRHPMEYRNLQQQVNPSIPAAKSLLCAILTTTVFVCPLFFETSVEQYSVGKTRRFNETHFQYVRQTTSL